tara:strand:+ start:307 stop:1476 length:1170 start_codon:yes stop_codon:yes gene_type:complete
MADKKGEFEKIINDFTKDLIGSYPELESTFDVIDYDDYYQHCKTVYPENFFHILYENIELFDDTSACYLLPNVNFKEIMHDESLSESSKKTIWKYIQLILFCVCNHLKDKDDFGSANHLFEAIQEDDLHAKIEETMEEMKNIFVNMDVSQGAHDCSFENIFEHMMGDISNVENMFNASQEGSGNIFGDSMDPEKMKDHLSGILGGKIGSLAKEIAEEASKELGLDQENMDESSQQDFLKKMFKDPTKLMDIVKNIGSKLEERFKNGDIKESELLEEAQDIMGKMKDMPGLKEMMSSMGLNPGGKMDFKGMANKMQQNMKQAKAKERMKAKLEKNKQAKQSESLGTMKEVSEDTFVWNDTNSSASTPLQKSSLTNKKKKGKKNKGKKKKN